MLRRVHQPVLVILIAGLVIACRSVAEGEATVPAPATPPVVEYLASSNMDPATLDRIDLALQAVHEEPEAWYAWLDLGMVYHANDFYPQAIASYEQAAALMPDQPKPHYLMGLALHREGHIAAAVEATRRAAEITPSEATFHWRLGHLLLEAGDLADAEAALSRALELDPDSDAALIGLARVSLQQDEPQEAVDYLKAAAGHTRWNGPYVNHLLVGAYRRLGEPEKAEHALLNASEMPPRYDDPWLAQVAHQRTSDVSVLRTAVDMLDTGQSDEAIRLLEGLQEDAPDDIKVLEALAIAYGRTDRLADAISLFERIVELDPSRAKSHEDLARALMLRYDAEVEIGNNAAAEQTYALAMEHVQKALELNPERAESHSLRGNLLRRSEQYAEAAAAYETAMTLAPSVDLYAGQTARAYMSAEDWAGAADVLQEITQRSPGDAAAWRYLAVSHLRLGRLSEAETALDKAAALEPENEALAATRQELEAARSKEANPISDAP